MGSLAEDLKSLGFNQPVSGPPIILARRRDAVLGGGALLSVTDIYPTHEAARGTIIFRNVDEVMQAIAALESTLPAIERLGRLAL